MKEQWRAQLSGVAHGTTFALLEHLSFDLNQETKGFVTGKKLSVTTIVRTAYGAADSYLAADCEVQRCVALSETHRRVERSQGTRRLKK